VLDYTNLQWPEAPFGVDHRPGRLPSDMLAAFALGWTTPFAAAVPVAAATVYLRIRRLGTAYHVTENSMAFGFRIAVIESLAELSDLIRLFDRGLTRSRRHAAILAGHRLGDDLTRLAALSTVPLRGVAGVSAGWTYRSVKDRGIALMVDTSVEGNNSGAELDTLLEPPVAAPVPHTRACGAELARTALARSLAIALTAAIHTGRYKWDGTFRVDKAIDQSAWDILAVDHPSESTYGANPPQY
jgi:hypothetical protein